MRCNYRGPFPIWFACLFMTAASLAVTTLCAAPADSTPQADAIRGQTVRLGPKAFRIAETPGAVTISTAGDRIYVVSKDGLIDQFNAKTGIKLASDKLDLKSIQNAAFAGDRRRLAAVIYSHEGDDLANPRSLVLVDVVDAQVLLNKKLAGRGSETAIAISHDGVTIALLDQMGMVQLWDTATGERVLEFQLPIKRTNGVDFSEDGQTLVAGGDEGVALWRWTEAAEPTVLPLPDSAGRRNRVLSLAVSPKGDQIALGLDGHDGLWLIDSETGELRTRWKWGPEAAHYTRRVAFNAEGDRVYVCRHWPNGGMNIVDVATGTTVQSLDTAFADPTAFAVSEDGALVAGVSDFHDTLNVWNATTGKSLSHAGDSHGTPPRFLHFIGDDQLISSGDDAKILVWDLSAGKVLRTMAHVPDKPTQETRWIRGFAVSPDGKLCASSSLDDTVRIWDVATGEEKYRLPGHGQLGGRRELVFTPDGTELISWGDDMRVYHWDVSNGKAKDEYLLRVDGAEVDLQANRGRPFDNFFMSMHGTAFTPDAKKLLLITNRVLPYDLGQRDHDIPYELAGRHALGLAMSPSGRYLATGRLGPSKQTPIPGGGARISAERVAIVHVSAVADGAEVMHLEIPGRRSGAVAFTPDEKYLLVSTTNEDGDLRVYRISDAAQVGETLTFRERSVAMGMARDGERVAISLRDGTILVLDLATSFPEAFAAAE